jgi:hypothetical protein
MPSSSVLPIVIYEQDSLAHRQRYSPSEILELRHNFLIETDRKIEVPWNNFLAERAEGRGNMSQFEDEMMARFF